LEFFDKSFCIEVWGDFACFTRPEMKVERVSYDVITPSAARAIFQAIFWKPAIQWQIEKIEVLNPIKWFSVRRNETAALAGKKSDGIFIEDCRQQKAGLILRDVKYRLHAKQIFVPPAKRPQARHLVPDELVDADEKEILRRDENPGKYHAIFTRRAVKGQCFTQPYLGCREFSCAFRLIEDDAEPAITISVTRDLGFMLYDMDYSDENNIIPMFFRAKLENGVVHVPAPDSEEVFR